MKQHIITVKNAEGDPDTEAEILIQNKINYTPKVSVIIPVYNVEEYLRECLDSVVNQTLKEIEIICVDDGSTDSSLEILKEYAKKDSRITVITQQNLHAGVARNAGLAVARGEYLSFLDSDDWFELNMLEESYRKACEQNADIVIFNWTVVDEIKNKRLLSTDGVPFFVKEKLRYDINYNFAQEISNNLFFISNPAPWNKLYKRDFILESSIRFQNLTCCNDIGFNTSALALSKKINIINKNFAYYRKHATNTSNTKSEEKSDNIIKAGYYILNNIKNNGLYKKLEDAFYRGISVSFYWEYCRTTDLVNQTNKYKQFLPEKYYNEFRAKFEGTRKRKIILVGSDNICDTTGGAITVFWERASLFANIGFNVTCVFDNKNKTEKDFNYDSKLKLVNINTYNDDKLSICEKFNILLKNEKPDLLIFFFPSMVHKYTKDIDISPYNSLLMLHSRPDVYFERDNIDGVIKSCNKIKYAQVLMPSFIPILKKYIKNQKIEIIPNYIDEPIIKEKIESYNKFIFYSRCDCGKNIPLLVNAFKIVHDKHPNWILDIYGQSEPESYMQKVSKLINLLNLTDYINYIPKSQIGRDVLNNADIFVFPSYFEGQGLGLCEGLSCGLPAIVLDKCSAVNEIVKDKYNGLYAKDCPIDFAEKMIQLIENVELRQKMSKNAIKSVEQYNKAAINDLWIKFVSNIINETFKEVNISNIEKKDIYDISYIHSKWDDFNPYTEAPEISVITSSYNTVQYIDECLDSILNQTFKNIEVICIDDHSTDGTYEKLLSYQEKDPRIKVFRNIKNMKLGWCRNFGINKARGDYIFFCDSDDFIKENTFELLYNNIKNNDAELCLYLLSIYNNDSKKIIDLENQNFDRIKKLNKNVFNWKDYPKSVFERVEAVLKLYKRDFLINNNIKFFEGCYFEDTIVHIKSISLAKKICFTDEKLYMYRKNREGQITGNSNNTEKFLDIFNYINEAENFFKENKIWRKIKNEYLWFAIERICGYYNRCDVLTRVSFSKKARDWLKNKDINEIRKNAGNLFPTFCKITNLTKSPSILKSYLLLPYYLLKIQHMKRVLDKKPSRLFSINKYGNKKVYRILGLKFAFNNFKKDVLDNQEKLVGLISDMSINVNKEINKQTQLLESKIKYIENKQVDLANNIKKEMDNIALLQNNLEAKVKEDVLSVKEANLYELNKINEEISANKEKLVALEDLISNTNQQINEAIVSSINANSDNILRLQSIVKSRGEDITSEISALYKEQSSQLQILKEQVQSNRESIVAKLDDNETWMQEFKEDILQKYQDLDCSEMLQSSVDQLQLLKEQAQSNRENIVAKLDSNNTNVLEFKKDILNKYQELNYADLLHDSIINCEWLKNKSFSLCGWAANYSFIYTLFRILDNVRPAKILEMGLGQTSLVTSQYVAHNNPAAEVDIIENDASWIDVYQSKLPQHANVCLHRCDIEFFYDRDEKNRRYQEKELKKITQDKKYNMIIVDGPMGGGQKFPRSNIMELVESNLAKDFVIIFDDAERSGEQNTIARTKEKLAAQRIDFGVQRRDALKSQVLIFSKSYEFVQFL